VQILRYVKSFLLFGLTAFLMISCLPNDVDNFYTPTLPSNYYVESLPGERVDSDTWWSDFMDQNLSELYAYALIHNYEIRIEKEKFRQKGLKYGITLEALDTSIGGIEVAFDIRENAPGSVFFRDIGFFSNMTSLIIPAETLLNEKNQLRIFDTQIAIDLFGKDKYFRQKALNDMAAEEKKLFGLYRNLRCDLSMLYTKIRSLQTRKHLLEEYIYDLSNYLIILESRIQAGLDRKEDWSLATSYYANAEMQLNQMQRDFDVAKFELATLVGQTEMSQLEEMLGIDFTIPMIKDTIYAGAPIDLLKNRADVLEAEKKVDEAVSAFGIAWANQYPTFRLSFTLDQAARQISQTLSAASLLYALGYNIQYNIYERWKLTAYYHVAKSEYRERITALNQTLAKALQEVSTSLIFFATACKHENDVIDSLERLINCFEEKRDFFKAKGTSFVGVIRSHQEKMIMQDRLDQATEAKTLSGLDLIKNLGG